VQTLSPATNTGFGLPSRDRKGAVSIRQARAVSG
jgi:hypothetical protein